MIIRVYRCTVVKGMEAEFRDFAYKTRHPWLRKRPAWSRSMQAGRFQAAMIALAAWSRSGKNWRQIPTLPEEARAFVESASVEHYELADEFRAE